MDAKTQARFEARSKVFKALSHPSRLYMVDVLSQGERCVCELTEMVGSDMSTVSKHLSVLKAAGLRLREGTEVDQKLSDLRRMYEPYIAALARFLCIRIPPWISESSEAGSWLFPA